MSTVTTLVDPLSRRGSHHSQDSIAMPGKAEAASAGTTSSHETLPVPVLATARGELLYKGDGTIESPYLVKFLPGDATNPLEFRPVLKWGIVAQAACAVLCVAFGSSVYAGGASAMVTYFNSTPTIVILGLTTYVIGFALGPLIWAPLSEMRGRKFAFLVTGFPFILFNIGCALSPNIETLLVCRLFAGSFGSAPLVNSGGSIADVFSGRDRGLAIAIFAICPFLGPVLGPIAGGFIGEYASSFRWIFWVMTIFSCVTWLSGFLIPETYAPVLLARRAAALSKSTGAVYVSEYEARLAIKETALQKLAVNMTRPLVFLFREPIAFTLSLFSAIVYGQLYLFFAAFPICFQQARGWSPGIGGLAFIGVGVGMILGIVIFFFEDRRYAHKLDRNGGRLPPEARLPGTMLGAILLPIGSFWFAWTVQPSIHWIVPQLASVPIGIAMTMLFMGITNYLIDVYMQYAASALATNAVLRCLFGAVFPLFAGKMFAALGNSIALTVIGVMGLLCAPMPFIFLKYGPWIRSKSKFAPGHAPLASAALAEEEKTTAQKLEEEEVRVADLRQEEVAQVDIQRVQTLEQAKQVV